MELRDRDKRGPLPSRFGRIQDSDENGTNQTMKPKDKCPHYPSSYNFPNFHVFPFIQPLERNTDLTNPDGPKRGTSNDLYLPSGLFRELHSWIAMRQSEKCERGDDAWISPPGLACLSVFRAAP